METKAARAQANHYHPPSPPITFHLVFFKFKIRLLTNIQLTDTVYVAVQDRILFMYFEHIIEFAKGWADMHFRNAWIYEAHISPNPSKSSVLKHVKLDDVLITLQDAK